MAYQTFPFPLAISIIIAISSEQKDSKGITIRSIYSRLIEPGFMAQV